MDGNVKGVRVSIIRNGRNALTASLLIMIITLKKHPKSFQKTLRKQKQFSKQAFANKIVESNTTKASIIEFIKNMVKRRRMQLVTGDVNNVSITTSPTERIAMFVA